MLDQRLIAQTRPKADSVNLVQFGNLRLTVLAPSLFRVEKSSRHSFCDEATQKIWFRDLPPVPFRQETREDTLVIETTEAVLQTDENMSFLKIRPIGMEEIDILSAPDADVLPGTCRTLDGCDGYVYSNFQKGDIHPVALVDALVSRSGAALMDDTSSLLLLPDGQVSPRSETETDLYVFAHGHRYREAIRDLYRISGFPPLLPRYALGNWWSRYHVYTDREYLDLMDAFLDDGLPFTVATVDMDWHITKTPTGESGWTGYTWNRDLFPSPEAFLSELHRRALHVTLNLHPALGVRAFEDVYPAMAKAMGMDPEEKKTIPFDITDPSFINAYFRVLHHPYEEMGVDFWWIDWQQGIKSAMDGLDPLWSLNHYHYLDACRKGQGLILSRYSGIGSQRYPVGFSGDTYISWDTLKIMPEFTSSASNAGYTWWSHDIGGHMMGEKNNELYLRFLQFGVFSPICRLHSTQSPLLHKEPEFYGSGISKIASDFLRLRHAMIPFLYSASVRTHEEGLSLIEPMYYQFPEVPEAYQCPGQYFFGQTMIAAPVTSPSDDYGFSTLQVFVPEGQWTDVFTGTVYQGPAFHSMTRDLESFPLLAREGSFFPLAVTSGPINSTDLPEALNVLVFSGSGQYVLTEDVNSSRARTTFRIKGRDKDGWETLFIQTEDPDGILPDRKLTLDFLNIRDGEAVMVSDSSLSPVRARRYHDHARLEVPLTQSGINLRIRDRMDRWDARKERIIRTLARLEMNNQVKDTLCRRLLEAVDSISYEAILRLFTLPDHARKLLSEESGL